MSRYSYRWIEQWCQENGWTDLFLERRMYWAFPPGAVMPLPIPSEALERIKARNGLSLTEKSWSAAAIAISLTSLILTWVFQSPMPLVSAFAFSAIVVAQLDNDE
ncbi:hypothetical protein BST81_10500 [Leptolyngbya sp. 'hensonii']|uniref:slr1957 family protein n=1 Tax=Leptolyngbya sp. 'hensonii' TaxID=1922337 RepID=UPI00094FCA78|nr:hypothetical protein [Leptolyngbya sp. 'hensonii']OLP18501.1 hypothetical protein BST81_10500 [Leptolyngbya sp. 'hensonii']